MPLASATLASLVTIAVVPRERFSHAPATLDSIHRHTPPDIPVVVVDGNPPAPIAREIAARSSARGYRLIRCDRFLSPNQARNLAVAAVATPYVVFCDNDLLVTSGWLEPLVAAAEELGADAVGPIYLFDEPEKGAVHMAGGELIWTEANGETLLDERQLYSNRPLAEIRHELSRGVCDYVEFHCMLVRMAALARTGPLDEELLSLAEHIDLALTLQRSGGTIVFEPASIVGYVANKGHTLADLAYFRLRWSDEWNQRTLRRFQEKWKLAEDCRFLDAQRSFVAGHQAYIGLPHAVTADRKLGWGAPQHGYAQTNIQLYNQLGSLGWAARDIQAAAAAYDLAVTLFGSLLRSNGKSFLAHVIGTASIMAAHGAASGAVAAALVHAAYTHGRFAGGHTGMTPENRAMVKAAIGRRAESILRIYTQFDWSPSHADRIAADIDSLALAAANIVFLRLTNVLEEYLDHGILYGGKSTAEAEAWLPVFTAIADRLGVRALADALATELHAIQRLPVLPPIRRRDAVSFAGPDARAAE